MIFLHVLAQRHRDHVGKSLDEAGEGIAGPGNGRSRRVCSRRPAFAKSFDRRQDLLAVAQLGDAEFFQVLRGQIDEVLLRLDGLFFEDRGVFAQAHVFEPFPNIHRRLPWVERSEPLMVVYFARACAKPLGGSMKEVREQC